MPISDLFSPLKRQRWLFLIVFLLVIGVSYAAIRQLPATQRTTIYFSLKPLISDEIAPTFDHAESTSKMAEAISGWAKNPQFREDVANEADVSIANFKRKLSARKQNYVNVFWTLKLTDDERQHSDKIIKAIVSQINKRFEALNQNSRAPYAMTNPEVFSENYNLPSWAVWSFILILATGLATVLAYVREMLFGRLSFSTQLEALFPGNPTLTIPEKLGAHDEKLLEQFILTFESPRLVGTFPQSEKHFSLSPADGINHTTDTPVLLVKLGETTLNELKNMKAIFGENLGLIVFEQ